MEGTASCFVPGGLRSGLGAQNQAVRYEILCILLLFEQSLSERYPRDNKMEKSYTGAVRRFSKTFFSFWYNSQELFRILVTEATFTE